MASTSTAHSPPEAPWKANFSKHLAQMESPEFVFTTVHASEGGSGGYVPRARYCIYRGFWAELPENKHNTVAKNERVYESDLPTFTTDQRMTKTFDLFHSSAGQAERAEQTVGSGGGGPCEAVWWIKDVMTQWRIKGEAFLIGPDIDEEALGGESKPESSGVRTVKSELGKRMRIVQADGVGQWSWGREVTGHFGNLSPGMRGSFKAPPPGQAVKKAYDEQKLQLGARVDDVDDAVARSNFRVVVIKPNEVERLDLSDPATARRHVYTFDEVTNEWRYEECWP